MNEDLFGSIKQTITETAGAVGKKTEEFVETQKMRNKVRTLQREIRKKYADVGEIVYKRYVDGDTMDEELTGHCEVVMGLQKELAECKESMAAKQGKNVCPACGISNPKDDSIGEVIITEEYIEHIGGLKILLRGQEPLLLQ